jgi:hypothetical protein
MVIDDWTSGGLQFPVVTVHSHSSEDGSLRDLRADWPSGKLDFKVIYTDGDSTDVMIRFEWSGTSMHLRDFKGVAVTRGLLSDEPAAIEYRIPRYSSVLSVPIELKGFRSSGEKAWDDLIATLSPEDQAAWAAIRTDQKNRPDLESINARVQAAFPGWKAIDSGEKKLSPEEERRLEQLVRDELMAAFKQWLTKTSLSARAQNRMLDHVAQRLPIGKSAERIMPR